MDSVDRNSRTFLNYRDSLAHTAFEPPKQRFVEPPPRSPHRPPHTSASVVPSSVAVVVIPGVLPPDLQSMIHAIMSNYNADEILLVATEEGDLKVAKMDCYTIAGQLRRDVLVQTSRVPKGYDGYALSLSLAALGGKTLRGVLCCLHGMEDVQQDVLDNQEAEVQAAWQSSVLTLHAIARHTIPLMSKTSGVTINGNGSLRAAHAPFFLLNVANNKNNSLIAAGQKAMLQALARSRAAEGVTIGYAEDVLPAPPVKKPSFSAIVIPPHTNGAITPESVSPTLHDSFLESPTRLWNLWAMQNE